MKLLKLKVVQQESKHIPYQILLFLKKEIAWDGDIMARVLLILDMEAIMLDGIMATNPPLAKYVFQHAQMDIMLIKQIINAIYVLMIA